jgi:hypothetical protein
MAKSSTLQTAEIRQVAVAAARTELAAVSAAISFWAGWVESAGRYTTGLGKELAAIEAGSVKSDEMVGRLTELSRQYLRELTELPRSSVKQFTSELEKISSRQSQPGPPEPRPKAVRQSETKKQSR